MSDIRAVVVDPTSAGKLIIDTIPAPTALPSEAIVNVKAFSLNRGEVRMSRAPRPNWRPGWDLAGVVEQMAADGSGSSVGSRVVGMVKSGAWAEKVAVATNQLAELPDDVSFAVASTLPVAGLTALHALWKGGFLLERPVLITGATGGVGDYAIQLAKLAGAVVVAHVRKAEQFNFALESGADYVVVGERLADAGQYGPYALILDSVGGDILGDALGLVEEGTKIVTFGTSAGNSVTFDAQTFYGKGMTTLYGLILFDELKTVESANFGLARLAKLVSKGKLKPRISVEDDWTRIDAVAQNLMDRTYPGKAVLRIGDEK